jgi:hypothetical protein
MLPPGIQSLAEITEGAELSGIVCGRIKSGKNQKAEEKGKSYLFLFQSANIPKKNSEHN